MASLACAAAAPKHIFGAGKADFDETSAVFLSDIHISGDSKETIADSFRSVIAEILRLNPLPRHVFIMGDISFDVGRRIDYEKARSELKLLADAGIVVTMAMGNHDHRKAFFECWPEYEKRSLVKDEVLTVTSLPDYDMIILDSLNETGGPGKNNIASGRVSEISQQWISENLPKWPRPFFIGAHHPPSHILFDGKMGGLTAKIAEFPRCRGFINGHTHIWLHKKMEFGNGRTVSNLTLPSGTYWGDVGYVNFKIEKSNAVKTAVASLIQKDFLLIDEYGRSGRSFFREIRIRGNKGAKCVFPI